MYDRKSTNTNKTVILGRLTCLGHKTPDYFPDVLQRLGAFCLNLRRKFVPCLNGGSPKCNTIHYSDDSGMAAGTTWAPSSGILRIAMCVLWISVVFCMRFGRPVCGFALIPGKGYTLVAFWPELTT